jgi:hypothetical protein
LFDTSCSELKNEEAEPIRLHVNPVPATAAVLTVTASLKETVVAVVSKNKLGDDPAALTEKNKVCELNCWLLNPVEFATYAAWVVNGPWTIVIPSGLTDTG